MPGIVLRVGRHDRVEQGPAAFALGPDLPGILFETRGVSGERAALPEHVAGLEGLDDRGGVQLRVVERFDNGVIRRPRHPVAPVRGLAVIADETLAERDGVRACRR